MSGRALSQRFYERLVGPRLDGLSHAAALLGDGSEVLGFDDEVSTDHDFGPRLTVFTSPESDPAALRAALADLPEYFEGFPVHPGGSRPHVEVTSVPEFFRDRIGTDPAAGMSLEDWLLTPTQRMATLVGGEVFHDPEGLLATRRSALRWYPPDVWRYVLAATWLRIGQEEAFVGRAASVGDDLGSRLVTARLARDLVRLGFLLERRWAPYSKWLGSAFAGLVVAREAGPPLEAGLRADTWRERERALCAASSALAVATNRLGLAEEVDPSPRQFFARDIRVLDAARFTHALVSEVTDPAVRALVDRLGRGRDAVLRLPGAIDQAVDSVDVLAHPDRCRAVAPALGL